MAPFPFRIFGTGFLVPYITNGSAESFPSSSTSEPGGKGFPPWFATYIFPSDTYEVAKSNINGFLFLIGTPAAKGLVEKRCW